MFHFIFFPKWCYNKTKRTPHHFPLEILQPPHFYSRLLILKKNEQNISKVCFRLEKRSSAAAWWVTGPLLLHWCDNEPPVINNSFYMRMYAMLEPVSMAIIYTNLIWVIKLLRNTFRNKNQGGTEELLESHHFSTNIPCIHFTVWSGLIACMSFMWVGGRFPETSFASHTTALKPTTPQ